MTDRSPHGGGDDGARIGRRAFLATGLSGAGLALAGPAAAAGSAAARAAARQSPETAAATPAASGPFTQMPLRERFPHLPAIPLDPAGTGDTLSRLETRAAQVIQAKQGLTHPYTLAGRTRTAYEWLYGATSSAPGTPLDDPAQFSIGWTTLPDAYRDGAPHLDAWAASLSDADAATAQFWPTIAEHGTGYNLILPERVTPARARQLRRAFRPVWGPGLEASAAAGGLYVVDLSIFESLEPQTVHGAPRFTPATVTLLTRHRPTGRLTPAAIMVSGHRGRPRRLFARGEATDGAWLYALQAAKTSIT
ncbi:MAG TPA: hypothetical protein VFR97_08425, partial [Capillimicrobium sp.]|nr:hypothetical protein [Capillimicrobium sp.]